MKFCYFENTCPKITKKLVTFHCILMLSFSPNNRIIISPSRYYPPCFIRIRLQVGCVTVSSPPLFQSLTCHFSSKFRFSTLWQNFGKGHLLGNKYLRLRRKISAGEFSMIHMVFSCEKQNLEIPSNRS